MPAVGRSKPRRSKKSRAVPNKRGKAASAFQQLPRFILDDAGVYANSRTVGWERISSLVEVLAQTRDGAGENWGRILRWYDGEGKQHEWTVSMELLIGDPAKVRAHLVKNGLPYISSGPRHRALFTEYLVSAPVARRIRSASKIGWSGKTFVLFDRAVSPQGHEETVFHQRSNIAHWGTRGDLEDWREHVGRLCSGNSRLLFLASCAFAGPLLGLIDAECGGFHLHGLTSSGKTTALQVAGSVEGGGGPSGFVQTWLATANALEVVAESHHHATLFLDELSQVNPAEAVDAAYVLGNGFGKSRLNGSAGTRPMASWKTFFASAGEMTLAMHAATAGKRTRGGAEIRLINLSADAGQQYGVFENLHEFSSVDDFARALKAAALRYYGTPFQKFVETLVSKRSSTRKILLKYQETFRRLYVPINATGEVRRAADRFALVAVAGELATRWGITGWTVKEALRAASRCFKEWVATHGESGSADLEAAIRRVRALLEGGESHFTPLHSDGHIKIEVHDRTGFVRFDEGMGRKEFLILPHIFRKACDGVSAQAVAAELERRGHLRRTAPHFTRKVRIPGFANPIRLFCVSDSITEEQGDI
jgi:putative DNA primase/helicase